MPGWSRAHVLSHIEGVGLALARQARYALRGELIAPYDGGRPARAAAIEAGALRDAAALREAVRAALAEASAAWAAVGPAEGSVTARGTGHGSCACTCWTTWRPASPRTRSSS